MRWHKVNLTFYDAAYFIGASFIMGGGSLRLGVIQDQIHLVYVALFFIVQGAVMIVLGYYKEKQSNPSMI